MEIIKAREMGFCFGVRRAVEMMEAAADELGGITSLGSTVHNRPVVDRLRGAGGGGGARPLAREGFAVIVFGDPDHKEVRGVLGWAEGKGIAVPDEELLHTLPDDLPSRVAVLSQTTHTEARFASFVRRLFETRMDHISELRVINTLCNATTSQQAAAQELARRVDLMIVIGGHDSANTRHLAEVCEEEGVETHHIESAGEIEPGWVAGHERLGVTAGASTPDFAV